MNLVLAFVIFFGIAWLATPQGGLTFAEVAGRLAGRSGRPAGRRDDPRDRRGDASTSSRARTRAARRSRRSAIGRARPSPSRSRAATGPCARSRRRSGPPPVGRGQGRPRHRGAQLVFTGEYAAGATSSRRSAPARPGQCRFTLILNGLADLLASIVANPARRRRSRDRSGSRSRSATSSGSSDPIFTLYLAGMLSANLALVNILPFPPLDGGRMLVLLLKALFGPAAGCCGRRACGSTGRRPRRRSRWSG